MGNANKKRKADEEAEAARQQVLLADIPVQLRLRMPAAMKKIILDDYELVTQKGKVLPLPRSQHGKPTVNEIIEQWKEEEGADIPTLEEIVAGLLSYFNNALRHCLLYQPEVPLCDAAPGEPAPSEVYGAEHLCRLFVKLPELVPVVFMTAHGDASYVLAVENAVHSLMSKMVEEDAKDTYFTKAEEYVKNEHWVPPPVYMQQATVPAMTQKSGGSKGIGQQVKEEENTVKTEPEGVKLEQQEVVAVEGS